MRRVSRFLRLVPLLLLLPLTTYAATAVDESQNDIVAPADRSVQVKLGESTVDLAGPWKFHVGDDNAWAQPSLDRKSVV